MTLTPEAAIAYVLQNIGDNDIVYGATYVEIDSIPAYEVRGACGNGGLFCWHVWLESGRIYGEW